MRIGDDLRMALSNPEGQKDVFDRLNRYEKLWRSMMNLNNKFMPGYDKTEHVTYSTTFNTTAVTNEQTIVNNTTYVYDGTYWKTNQVYQFGTGLLGQSANLAVATQRVDTSSDGIIVQNVFISTRVITTNDASNRWNYNVYLYNGNAATDTLVSSHTGADSVGIYTNHDADLSDAFYDYNSQTSSFFYMTCTKTGSPGNLDVFFTVEFRYVRS